jgi:hypothetical protein
MCVELVELSAPTDSIPQLAERLQKLAELANRARIALAQPVAPTSEELDELFASVDEGAAELNWRTYARAVLARWGTPAIEPVQVSERLPGPEDCDAEGRCWMFDPCDRGWWCYREALPSDGDPEPFAHWLPHWALPMPAPANTTRGTH